MKLKCPENTFGILSGIGKAYKERVWIPAFSVDSNDPGNLRLKSVSN